jgi:ABC-type glutathione transport system ATPase component
VIGLVLERLTIATPDRVVVEEVSLSVAAGEIVAVLGETGSGKSLIGSAIMGLSPPGVSTTGTVVVDGEAIPVADHRRLRRLWSEKLFLLPQEPLQALAPLLSAGAQVAEQLPHRDARLARAALGAMDLAVEHHGKRPFELSGGMAQRVLAAIASVTRAGILVADEPTKGLDADRRGAVAAAFAALRAAGRAILLITHDIGLARRVSDQVAFLHEGRFVEVGPSRDVLAAPRSDYGQRYVASDPALWARRPYVRSSTEKVVEATRLTVGVGGRVLAKDLNFHCHASHISALQGSSGVGKTTLGRTLLGLTPPLAGSIRRPSPHRPGFPGILKLHQDPTRVFSPWQTIGRSLEDLRRLPDGAAALRAVPPLLDRLGLGRELLERLPHQVSGGEAQRLALVRVLAMRPRFLVADEPTSRLDPPIQADVIRHLRAMADEGLSILLITHDGDLAAAVADRRMRLSGDGSGLAALLDVTRDETHRLVDT